MSTILINMLAIVGGMISISQYYMFASESDNQNLQKSYKNLAFFVAASSLVSVITMLTYSVSANFVFYMLNRLFKVIIVAEIIWSTKKALKSNSRLVSAFMSYLLYGSALLVVLDIIFKSGELGRSSFGVYFYPELSFHRLICVIYYVLFFCGFIWIALQRDFEATRKSERHERLLLNAIYICGALGYVGEPLIIVFRMPYIPVSLLFNIVTVILVRKCLCYQQSVSIEESIFAKELDPSITDVIFVLDDNKNIIYQNKRAQILSLIMKDEYLGRRLYDVFSLPEDYDGHKKEYDASESYGLTAVYENTGRKVNLVVRNRFDNYKEILASVVYVYNMEEREDEESNHSDVEALEDDVVENALAITGGTRVLVVDEDVLFINIFTRMLSRYNMSITRSISGYDALHMLEDNVYDIIFVAYEMEKISGVDMVKSLRKMKGEYYSLVPVVFMSGDDIGDIYNDMLEAGFNDFVKKPVNNRILSQVLTRWTWQRFDESLPQKALMTSTYNGQYTELNNLIDDAEKMFMKDNVKFAYCINGIKHAATVIGIYDIAELADVILDEVMFDNMEALKPSFDKLVSGVRDISMITA